jgi:hypothetical protein
MLSAKDALMSNSTDRPPISSACWRERDEMLRLEQFCLEQAEKCATAEGKGAFLSLAGNYRAAAERATSGITARNRTAADRGSEAKNG